MLAWAGTITLDTCSRRYLDRPFRVFDHTFFSDCRIARGLTYESIQRYLVEPIDLLIKTFEVASVAPVIDDPRVWVELTWWSLGHAHSLRERRENLSDLHVRMPLFRREPVTVVWRHWRMLAWVANVTLGSQLLRDDQRVHPCRRPLPIADRRHIARLRCRCCDNPGPATFEKSPARLPTTKSASGPFRRADGNLVTSFSVPQDSDRHPSRLLEAPQRRIPRETLAGPRLRELPFVGRKVIPRGGALPPRARPLIQTPLAQPRRTAIPMSRSLRDIPLTAFLRRRGAPTSVRRRPAFACSSKSSVRAMSSDLYR